jgi:hypothetical protein
MSQALRKFASECFLDSHDPRLMNQFTRMDHTYNAFCTHANATLGSSRPKSVDRSCTGLCKVCQNLVGHWVEFVNSLNNTTEQNTTPHFQIFANTCTLLISQLDRLEDLLESGCLKSGVSRLFFERIQADAADLRKDANAFFRMSTGLRAEQFVPSEFDRRIGSLANAIGKVYVRAVPRCTMSTGEVMYSRTCLNATCNDLMRISHAIATFEGLASNVRRGIARTSQMLDRLFDELGVPLGIKLEFDEEEDQAEKMALSGLPVSEGELLIIERKQALDGLRDNVGVIGEALDETDERARKPPRREGLAAGKRVRIEGVQGFPVREPPPRAAPAAAAATNSAEEDASDAEAMIGTEESPTNVEGVVDAEENDSASTGESFPDGEDPLSAEANAPIPETTVITDADSGLNGEETAPIPEATVIIDADSGLNGEDIDAEPGEPRPSISEEPGPDAQPPPGDGDASVPDEKD